MRKENIFFATFLMIACEITLVGSFNEPQEFHRFFSDRVDGLLRVINLKENQLSQAYGNLSIPRSSLEIREIVVQAKLNDAQIQAVLDKLQETRHVLAQSPSDDNAANRFIYAGQYSDARVRTITEKVYGEIRTERALMPVLERRRLKERR